MHGTREALSIAVLLLVVFGPWLVVPVGSFFAYRVARRSAGWAGANVLGALALVALGAAVLGWVVYVGPALHKPGQSCPDPGVGVAVGGYASVILPTLLLASTAGFTRGGGRRNVWQGVAWVVAASSLIALLVLQGAMFCHFGD